MSTNWSVYQTLFVSLIFFFLKFMNGVVIQENYYIFLSSWVTYLQMGLYFSEFIKYLLCNLLYRNYKDKLRKTKSIWKCRQQRKNYQNAAAFVVSKQKKSQQKRRRFYSISLYLSLSVIYFDRDQ